MLIALFALVAAAQPSAAREGREVVEVGPGADATAPLAIVHRNRMSAGFRLVRSVFVLDEEVLVDRGGGPAPGSMTTVAEGKVSPGPHVLRVDLYYQGSIRGAVRYLEGYRFRVSAQFRFTTAPGIPLRLEVLGHEQGGPTTPWEEKPAIGFRMVPRS